MTYWQFHLVFILPAIVLLATAAWRRGVVGRRELLWLGAMALIALCYTTLWDNYLVARGVWDYSPNRVIGTIGWVPIEEYLFFLLQPILTGLWLYLSWDRWAAGEVSSDKGPTAGRVATLTTCLVLGLIGGSLLFTEPGLYLGLILVWACPVLLLQVAVGWQTLWHNRRLLLVSLAVPTAYLWLCDRIAIGLEIWRISERYTLGVSLAGLPLEEAAFFLVTNMMLIQGLILFRLPSWSRLRRPSPASQTG